ncbi:MAG: recombinase-like helix-turn-helix domain-containing protein [Betaproteobacteria bacterium]
MEFNPYLKPGAPSSEARKGSIEKVDAVQNLVWQTRAAPPTGYENRLGDLLEQAFAEGIEELAALVARLNELGSRAPDGTAWTEASFRSYMRPFGE